jgi:hypothetical protein
MCGFLQSVAGFARCVFGAVCLCLCIGPILIILGAVFLAGKNTRDEDVKNYNANAADYNRVDAPILQQATLSVDGVAFTRQVPTVVVKGDTSGVTATNHYVFTAGGIDKQDNNQYVVNFQAAFADAQTVAYTIPFTATVDRNLLCDSARCTDKCNEDKYSCDESRMRFYCTSSFSGSYTDRSGSCLRGDTCGTCRFTGNLASACVVMALSSEGRASASTMRSCYYPFTQHEYLPGSQTATIELMSERDPFIALQRITGGSNDFGIGEDEQRNAGIAMLIIGIVVTVIMACIAIFFVRRQQRIHEEQRLAQGPPPQLHPTYAGADPYANNGPRPYSSEPGYAEPAYAQPYSNPPKGAYPVPMTQSYTEPAIYQDPNMHAQRPTAYPAEPKPL